ncbi:transposase zinc-binding domain-containing protein [Clostridium sp. 19966]|uniref:transposase zinc-binding domain-containing protein n=1 Tax=Clostridium sp. 19966 TaxID=2768166 RepID=UPI0028E5C886|nr:transposase zinc-binding domain-containing protein [Clostridium sp. 19966]
MLVIKIKSYIIIFDWVLKVKSGIIKKIFKENWYDFIKLYGHQIRDVVFKEVNKMMYCGDISRGYIEFECPNCKESIKKVLPAKADFVLPAEKYMLIIE